MNSERILAAIINKGTGEGQVNYTGVTSDANLIHNLLMGAYFWAGLLATAIIIVAGFYYVTSNGNPQQITRAKNAILGSVIGLIVIMSAFIITNTVLGGIK